MRTALGSLIHTGFKHFASPGNRNREKSITLESSAVQYEGGAQLRVCPRCRQGLQESVVRKRGTRVATYDNVDHLTFRVFDHIHGHAYHRE